MLKLIQHDYYIEIKRLKIGATLLFLVLSMLVIYIKLSGSTEHLVKMVNKDVLLIENDFNKLSANYSKQLTFVRDNVRRIGFNNKKLEEFFQSTKTLILDMSSITAIITDKEFNIKFFHPANRKIAQENIANTQIKNRLYIDRLKNSPNEVIIGEIVQGVLTRKLSIPLAITINDAYTDFNGCVIFSVELESISKELAITSLDKVILSDYDDISHKDQYIALTNSPKRFFLKKILDFRSEMISISKFNEPNNKYLYLNYNLNQLRRDFLQDICFYLLTILILTGTLSIIVYYYALLPIKKSLSTLNQLTTHNGNDIVTNHESNLFNRIAELITLLSNQLEQQKLLYSLQENRLVETVHLYKHIINYVNDKTEGLSEDISDVVFSSKEPMNEDLLSIQRFADENEQDIKHVIAAGIEAWNIVNNDDRTLCNIYDLLIQSGIDLSRIEYANQSFHSFDIKNIRVNLYTKLFFNLVGELLSCETDRTRLKQVQITDHQSIDFTFFFQDNEVSIPKIILQRVKIWAAFNNIKINLKITDYSIVISCNFPKTEIL